MAKNIPTFAIYKNKVFVAFISAVSERQAHETALYKYGRCEVMLSDNSDRNLPKKSRIERADSSFTHGRSPYATGDFEARRQAEIAKWKAAQA
jgi:hypothetical protein